MRILANENVPELIVERLRDARHDVSWVRADSPGATDQDVLQRAITEDRVILTFDKDFGELAFQGEGQRFHRASSCSACMLDLPMS